MRNIVSCFSENSVNVSCSSIHSNNNNTCISPTSLVSQPSIQNSVSSVYKLVLSNLNQLLITVTWCRSHSNQGLSISFGDEDPSFTLNTNSRFFRKKKGSKLMELSSSTESKVVEIFWDLSNAKYDSGPEPVEGFYLVVLVDSQIGLILGDMGEEEVSKKFKTKTPLAKVSILTRREYCSGNSLYSTKAQFCDNGTFHDVLIKCGVEKNNEGLFKDQVLSVCIDKKTVIRVKRLHWNFRGNQTIFVDGLLVDFLWDVHDWFFFNSHSASSSSSSSVGLGYAVFMFRTRSGVLDSRLWLEDKKNSEQKDKDRVEEFSLLIYASKSS